MFKFYFEDQYCVQKVVKRGAIFYIGLAMIAMPAGLCSQQHQIPAYQASIVRPMDWNCSAADRHRDHELALLENAVWEQAHKADAAMGGQERTDAPDEHAPPFHRFILQAAETYQIDAALIRAVIMVESSNNPRAVSHRGAQGLMQLMPSTARWLGVDNAFDPALNIDAGVRYLRNLIDRFQGDIELALAAYNAGSRYVRKYGGIPPFKATRTYVKKVLKLREGYRKETADLKTASPAA